MRRLSWIILGVLALLASTVGPSSALQLEQDSIVRVRTRRTSRRTCSTARSTPSPRSARRSWSAARFTQAQNAGGGATLTRNSIMAFNKDTGRDQHHVRPAAQRPGEGARRRARTTRSTSAAASTPPTARQRTRSSSCGSPTGRGSTTFNPGVVSAIVRDIRYTAGRLFIGGEFTKVAGVTRARLAELNPTTGALLPTLEHPGRGHALRRAVRRSTTWTSPRTPARWSSSATSSASAARTASRRR